MSSFIDRQGHPMMGDNEMAVINKLLRESQVKVCLEWGSGNSTVYFPTENPFIEEWIAVEHNRLYLEILQERLPKNASIAVIDPKRYVEYPGTLNKKFDFILIDGISRYACLKEAFNLVKKDGIILLHDAFRQESKWIIEEYRGKFEKLTDGEKLQPNGFYAHRGLIRFIL